MNTVPLSDLDHRIVTALARDGRLPYKELAARVGVPTSTCHGRVRALAERGVLRGFRADIAPEALGHQVSALVMVRVHPHHRDRVPAVTEELRQVPGVQQLFLIGGDEDLVVHVACAGVPALRELIATRFGAHPALARTRTQIVFEHDRGTHPI